MSRSADLSLNFPAQDPMNASNSHGELNLGIALQGHYKSSDFPMSGKVRIGGESARILAKTESIQHRAFLFAHSLSLADVDSSRQ